MKIDVNSVISAMSYANAPVEYVDAGDVITVSTLDCFSNKLRKEEFCIMPDNPPYWRNKRLDGLVRHEVMFGVRNRQKSIDDGLVVFLIPQLHNMSDKGVHFNREFDLLIKNIYILSLLNYAYSTTRIELAS